jgi:hypothetical protein
MKIKVGKRYRSGEHEGVVLSTTRNHPDYPVVLLGDNGQIYFFRSDGGCMPSGEYPGDLQEIPKSYWVNVYETHSALHPTRRSADSCAVEKRIACVEVKEGDGL